MSDSSKLTLNNNSSTLINNLPNPGAYIDQVISLRIVRMLEGIFENFTWKSLVILLTLAGAEEGKKIIVGVIQYYKKYLSENYMHFNFSAISQFIRSYLDCLIRRQRPVIQLVEDIIVQNNSTHLEFKPNDIFWKSLYNTNNLKYKITNNSLEQINKNEYKLIETWENISVCSKTFDAYADSSVEMSFDIINGVKTICDSNMVMKDVQANYPKHQNVFDLIPDKFIEFKDYFRTMIVNTSANVSISSIHLLFDLYSPTSSSVSETTNRSYPNTDNLTKLFDTLNSELEFTDAKRSKLQLIYLMSCIIDISKIKDHKKLFGVDISKLSCTGIPANESSFYFMRKCPMREELSNWFWAQVNPKFVIRIANRNSSENFLNLKITEKVLGSNLDLIQEWQNFIFTNLKIIKEDIITNNKERKPKIKIHDIRMLIKTIEKKNTIMEDVTRNTNRDEDDSEINSEDNSEDNSERSKNSSKDYEKVQIKKSNKLNYSPRLFANNFKIETEIIKEIQCEYTTSTSKEFNTLYLKQKDEFVLKNLLDRFKNREDIFERLGIPYKLGIMMHGEPGCGKSSTVTAVATELQAPIYYMDLKNVKTNEDLKKLWKYVNQTGTKNGIIVLEDIDAMTNIVFKRTEEHHGNEGDLTLDCLLNLMQGSLTEHGSIFIVTTNHLEKLDPAFYREGRFDICMKLTACDHYQMNKIYKMFFEKPFPVDVLETIPENTITPAKFIHALYPYVLNYDNEETILDCIRGLVV